jgi:hypothetical protein
LAKLCDIVYETNESVDIAKLALEQVSNLKEKILITRRNDEKDFFKHLTHDLNVLEHEVSIIKSVTVRNMIQELKQNETFKKSRVLGYSLRNDDQVSSIFIYDQINHHMVIIFKGTQTVADWLINLDLSPKESSNIFGDSKFKLHGGFQNTFLQRIIDFDSTFDQILKLYAEELSKSKLKVTVTGHSLGGALSTIAAYYIKNKYHDIISNVSNISFASPRVFTECSAQIIEDSIGKTNILRIWNQIDPIPLLPSQGFYNNNKENYKHIGHDIMFKDNELTFPHSMKRYIQLTKEKFPTLESLKREKENQYQKNNLINK